MPVVRLREVVAVPLHHRAARRQELRLGGGQLVLRLAGELRRSAAGLEVVVKIIKLKVA